MGVAMAYFGELVGSSNMINLGQQYMGLGTDIGLSIVGVSLFVVMLFYALKRTANREW